MGEGGARPQLPSGNEGAGVDRSAAFVVGEDGLAHRTGRAGVGDGVLFFDAGMNRQIQESREYVFAELG